MISTRIPRVIASSTQCFLRTKATQPKKSENLLKTSEAEKPGIDIYKNLDYFGVHKLFSIEDLFRARVHLGHTPRATAIQMKPFIYGSRFDTTIIDLDETALLLRQALNFLAHIAYKNGVILFVVKQPQLVHLVERTAIESGEYAHCRRWDPAILTGDVVEFGYPIRKPDAIILVHTKDGVKYEEHDAIRTAARLCIPTVGIVDTDCNPNLITYPIPGNDDSLVAQQLYLHLMKQAILLGKKAKRDESESL